MRPGHDQHMPRIVLTRIDDRDGQLVVMDDVRGSTPGNDFTEDAGNAHGVLDREVEQ